MLQHKIPYFIEAYTEINIPNFFHILNSTQIHKQEKPPVTKNFKYIYNNHAPIEFNKFVSIGHIPIRGIDPQETSRNVLVV